MSAKSDFVDPRWAYLYSPEWRVRHAIANWAVYRFSSVEVGAFVVPTSCNWWIDPLGSLPPDWGDSAFRGTVLAWLSTDECDVWASGDRGPRGLVALGLDIEGDDAEWTAFMHLVNEADRLVIEWAVQHDRGAMQAAEVCASRRLVSSFDLRLPEPKLPGYPAMCQRRLVILE